MQGELFNKANIKNKYEQIFIKAYESLNEEQQKAVDQIEGPVLVNAGPGTGKTQILALRIGKILRETDTAPHNILCLTYTDSATVSMRNRLVEIIGPAGHQVHIYTFHGFCNQVIQENLDFFGNYKELEPVSDLERIDIYRSVIDQLPEDNILKRYKADKYYEVKRLRNLFEMMKKENLNPQELKAKIDSEIEEQKSSDQFIAKKKVKTKSGKEYVKGDFRDDWFETFEMKYLETKAAIDQFEIFEKVMSEAERYDYSDMILWVLQAFAKNEYLLLQYQERYQYFLVDEYQDTNGAQNGILALLISYWDRPNVFVVGDDDQAIYKFQGANLGNIVDFKNTYDPEVITLKNNYRSNQHILNASQSLISFNEDRLVNTDPSLSKELIAAGDHATDGTNVRILSFEKLSAENTWIAKSIENLYLEQPHHLNDVAVIYRNHSQVADLVDVLESRNIPINIKKRIDVLEIPLIKNLITILRFIELEHKKLGSGDRQLFELMHFTFFNIDALDIAKIALSCQKKNKEGHYQAWREIISDTTMLEKIQLHNKDAISHLANMLNKWIKDIRNVTLQMLFENIINEGAVLRYIMQQNDRSWLLQILNTLFDYIKDETARNPELSLTELLDHFEKMKDNNLPLAINKIISSERGVNFVTAHSAKGQEFKKVFLIGSTKNIWDKNTGNRNQYKYPEGVNANSDKTPEDERRLFYVAMTRAKTDLVISYSLHNNDGKELGASQYVDELIAEGDLKSELITVPEDTITEFYCQLLTSFDKQIPLIDKDLIDRWFEGYRLSVTHLNKYLRCPITFYFEAILKVPNARNAATGFGSAMHGALHRFFQEYKKSKQISEQKLLHYFDESLKNYRSHFTEEEFQSYLTHGKNCLTALLLKKSASWFEASDFALEEEISNAEYEGFPIKGFLDKVEIYKNHVVVTDYKTGKYRKEKLRGPSDKDPNGGDYWRQLVFYKILLSSDARHNWNMVTGKIEFIEPDRKTGEFQSHKHIVSPEDVHIVGKQIQETYQKINNYEFDKSCGEKDCYWCQFIEHNYTLKPQLKETEHSYDS